jgi:uncharacterized protein
MSGTIRRAAVLIAIGLLAAGVPAIRAAAPDPNAWTARVIDIHSADGTPLRTSVFLPAGLASGQQVPVILLVTPYGGSGGDAFGPDPLADATPRPSGFATSGRIFERGYAYVEVRLRGVGGSGGCYDLGGLGEQADAKAAVEWAARQPWSTGKVGMLGHSYDGQTQLMALAAHARGLAAVIPGAPPSGYLNSFTNGVSLFTGRGFPAFYAANDLVPPSMHAKFVEHEHALIGTLTDPACYVRTVLGALTNDPTARFWTERDLVAKLRGTQVPMLWIHGFDDFNVRPASGLAAFEAAAGFKRAILGAWDHSIPTTDPTMWTEMRLAWFDAFLKNDATALATVEGWPFARVQERDGTWRGEATWPPAGATSVRMPVRAGSYLNAPGNNGEVDIPPYAQRFAGASLPVDLPTGIGTWTFSQPLPREVHLAGVPRLRVDVSSVAPAAHVAALLYDVDAQGRASMVLRGAALLKNPGRATLSFDLAPQDLRFARGHRIGLLLAAGDTLWLEPGLTLLAVKIHGGQLALPTISGPDTRTLGPFGPSVRVEPFVVSAKTMRDATVNLLL